jgi:hypothetical protein
MNRNKIEWGKIIKGMEGMKDEDLGRLVKSFWVDYLDVCECSEREKRGVYRFWEDFLNCVEKKLIG